MTTAFVLSGGASLGAVQAGMLLALSEADVRPDLLVGTSVGAVNAAWAAQRPGGEGARSLAGIWAGVRRRDVFPIRPLVGFLGFFGSRSYLVPPTGLRDLLGRHLEYERLEDAPLPLVVVATEVMSGEEVGLRTGPVVDAVSASAAIPGVFPPVKLGGHLLMDGGVVNNAAVSHAVDAGATTAYVLSTGYACALRQPPRSALAMSLHAVTLLVQQRLATDVERYAATVDLRVVPPPCPVTVSPLDFSRSRELVEMGYSSTAAWLSSGAPVGDPVARLTPHPH